MRGQKIKMAGASTAANKRSLSKDGTKVDGIPIVGREQATLPANDPGWPPQSWGSPIKTVEYLLLEDESEAFLCVHKGGLEPCTAVFTNVRSTLAHQRTHTGSHVAAQAAKQIADLRKQIHTNRRSNGGKKAAVTRATNIAKKDAGIKSPTPMSVPPEVNPSPQRKRSAPTMLGQSAERVIIAYNAMVKAQDEFAGILTGYMRAVHTEHASVPPDIAAKAAKWDSFVALRDS